MKNTFCEPVSRLFYLSNNNFSIYRTNSGERECDKDITVSVLTLHYQRRLTTKTVFVTRGRAGVRSHCVDVCFRRICRCWHCSATVPLPLCCLSTDNDGSVANSVTRQCVICGNVAVQHINRHNSWDRLNNVGLPTLSTHNFRSYVT